MSCCGNPLWSVVLFTFLTAFTFSMCAVILRQNTLPPLEISAYAFLATLAFQLPFVTFRTSQVLGPRIRSKLMVATSVCNALNIISCFICFKYLPVAQSMVTFCTVPAIIPLFAKLFLKEHCGKLQILASAIVTVGLVVSADPRQLLDSSVAKTRDTYIGFASGIVSLIFCCARIILVRKLQDVHHTVLTFNGSIAGCIIAIIATFAMGGFTTPNCGHDYFLRFGVVVSFFLSQKFFVLALLADKAGKVMIFECAFEVLCGVLWQVLLFRQPVSLFTALGCLLVVCPVLLIGFRNWLLLQPEGSAARERCKIFLLYCQ